MSLPWNINASMGGASTNYQISRSLRFRASASAYLSRTLGTPTSGTTWTWSGWVKRGSLGAIMGLQHAYSATNNQGGIYFGSNDTITLIDFPTSTNCNLTTTQVFRDPSAWYHIVVAVDTTQATSSNRAKIYLNGVQVTSFSTATYPTLNTTFRMVASGNTGSVGRYYDGTSYYFDGYMAEVNFIDGQQLTPSSFGYYNPYTGVWQPHGYTGTYGTNGFYLKFTDIATTSGSNFGLGKDFSGNGNYWATNNISVTAGATYDSMIDSPTPFSDSSTGRGNYCTGNPLLSSSSVTFSNANLTVSCGGAAGVYRTGGATFGVSSKKWYWEFLFDNTGGSCYGGVGDITQSKSTWESDTTINTNFWFVSAFNGNKINGNGGGVSYGSSFTTSDICMVALDCDNGKIWWGKNGTWFASGDPAAGTNAAYTNLSGKILTAAFQGGSGAGYTNQYSMNFGQRPFSYTPPTGFVALNTNNLPTPTIPNGAAYMAASTYTGTGAAFTLTNGGNNTLGITFQPDFVWQKARSTTSNHFLADSVRGVNKELLSDSTAAEFTSVQYVTAFNSNGFSFGTDTGINTNGTTYIGWQWKAGGTSSSNTSGTITSTVSANTTAGFSVVTYTGNEVQGATVGHGLGVAPSMVIIKDRTSAQNWAVWHTSLSSGYFVYLNLTAAQSNAAPLFNGSNPSSTVITLAGGAQTDRYTVNKLNDTYVAYCFAAVSGYSAFGSYTGNASADGPFIFTGFRPRFILFKNASAAADWTIIDTSRDPYNAGNHYLFPDLSNAEGVSASTFVDILSNGFKIRAATSTELNGSGNTIIYAGFAENPFKYSLAR